MDLVFACGMFFFGALGYTQTFMYPSDKPYLYTVTLSYLSIVMFCIFGCIEGYAGVPMKTYTGVSLMTYCALMKALSTSTKFAYQVFLNYRKKSTRGVVWQTMVVDLCASILGLVELQIFSSQRGYGFLTNDPRLNFAKFLLTFFSGSFDIIILIQIFCIYPDGKQRRKKYK